MACVYPTLRPRKRRPSASGNHAGKTLFACISRVMHSLERCLEVHHTAASMVVMQIEHMHVRESPPWWCQAGRSRC